MTSPQGKRRRVLLVSKFVHHLGGVETYLAWLAKALQKAGNEVAVLGMTPPPDLQQMDLGDATVFGTPSRSYTSGSFTQRATSAAASIYSPATAKEMTRALEQFRPDVVHYHGTCYQLTSSVVRASAGRGLRRIATAHEYKLVCANQRLYDDSTQKICELCVGASRLGRLTNPVRTACIKGSRGASLIGGVEAVVSDLVWRGADDLSLHTPSRFMAETLVRDGWSRERITTLDLPWPDQAVPSTGGGRDFLYLGRLFPEKDISTLIEGWRRAQPPGARLLIAGDGPQDQALQEQVRTQGVKDVVFTGRLAKPEIQDLLRGSAATVHPAAWFENSPFAVRESLMAGVPALVADTGGMPELIREGVTGRLVQHTPEGWAAALSEFRTPHAGADVLAAVREYRTSEADHLDALIKLYDN